MIITRTEAIARSHNSKITEDLTKDSATEKQVSYINFLLAKKANACKVLEEMTGIVGDSIISFEDASTVIDALLKLEDSIGLEFDRDYSKIVAKLNKMFDKKATKEEYSKVAAVRNQFHLSISKSHINAYAEDGETPVEISEEAKQALIALVA